MHKVIRRHTSLLTSSFLYAALILFLIFGIRYYLNFDYWGYFWPWVSLISIAVAVLFVLAKFSVWSRDHLIISDKRVVYNHQKGIFNKVVIEALYSDIVEVSYGQKGFAANLYGYGNVKIKTTGGVINFRDVPKPQEVVEYINNQREKYLNG